MIVKDYMTINPKTAAPDDNAKDVAEMMKAHNYRQCPVLENGKLVGIVTEMDMAEALSDNEDVKVREIMVTDPITIVEDAPIESASDIIRIKNFNSLPVVSQENELLGIITVIDILDAMRATLSFQDKPIKLEVLMSEKLSLFDVLHLIQNNSEKVISFSSAPLNRRLSHFWVLDCDLGRIDKVLREHDCTVSVVHSED
jgi:acetoin utilization protein AcuB